MNLAQQRFLITGAAGFIGAYLTHALVKQGLCPHVALMHETNAWRLAGIRDAIITHDVDLLDSKRVKALIREIKPTVVYHFAAHGAYPQQQDVSRIISTNMQGTWNILEALKDTQLKVCVSAGTSSEYGYKNTPMIETDVLEPSSIYAISKVGQAHLCRYVAQAWKIPVVTLRFFSIYGPWEEPTRLIPTILRRALAKQPLQMADPLTARDFVFAADVVKACLNIDALTRHAGDVFNIATGYQYTLKDVVATLERVMHEPLQVAWGSYAPRSWDTSCWVGDATKAKKLLQWEASTSFEDGLRQTLAWIRQYDAT